MHQTSKNYLYNMNVWFGCADSIAKNGCLVYENGAVVGFVCAHCAGRCKFVV